MNKLFFHFSLIFLLTATCFASTINETFDSANSNWDHSAGISSFSGGKMHLATSNLSTKRVTSTFTLTGDFEIVVQGSMFWSGGSLPHLKHYIGIYHSGATSTDALRLHYGGPGFPLGGDTHYHIDLNDVVGAAGGQTKSYTANFVKSGNDISTFSHNGATFQALNTFAIENTNADLRFEFAELDGTSGGSAFSSIDSFDLAPVSAVPEASSIYLFVIALSALCVRKR